jgi:hypothetical protein
MYMKEETDRSNLIAYCGLYCGQCHGYTGTIPDLARDLRKELRQMHYDEFAGFISTYSFGKDFKGYDECYKVLGAMVKFRCRKGCRAGGGSPFCKIRKCAQKKQLEGCWECPDFETCKELIFLERVHGDAHIRNLRAIKKKGTKDFIDSNPLWYHKKKQ